jgi:hypothetical protein
MLARMGPATMCRATYSPSTGSPSVSGHFPDARHRHLNRWLCGQFPPLPTPDGVQSASRLLALWQRWRREPIYQPG